MRPSGASVAEEIIELVEVAVVGTCKHIVDKHNTYTARVAVDDYPEEEDVSDREDDNDE